MSLNRLITFLFFISPLLLQGQGRDIPINISLFNESTAIPFTRFFTLPVHPGIQAGTEFDYKVKTHARLFQTANIGYFYHNYLAQGIGLNSEFGYEYRFKQGLAFSALLGIGYMHTFATTEEFTFPNGQFKKKNSKGTTQA